LVAAVGLREVSTDASAILCTEGLTGWGLGALVATVGAKTKAGPAALRRIRERSRRMRNSRAK